MEDLKRERSPLERPCGPLGSGKGRLTSHVSRLMSKYSIFPAPPLLPSALTDPMRRSLALFSVALALPALLVAQPPEAARQGTDTTTGGGPRASQFSGLRFRGIGPAMASGRVGE